jgi:hypothetical protein
LLLLEEFRTAFCVDGNACLSVIPAAYHTHDGPWFFGFNFLLLYLLSSIQGSIDQDTVLLVFWQLLIKELSLAIEAFRH